GGGEPPTADIARAALDRGVRLAVPAWVPDCAFDSCAFPEPGAYAPALVEPGCAFSKGPLGIPEPEAKTWVKPEEIDLWIVPGLLFDREKTRLGHGKGFIDRMLARRRPDSTVIALAYRWQIFDGVIPRTAHDVPMDRIIELPQAVSTP
ncbi:MAG: 5-formyltetrahydrofolate cyclo-ligase, partial [Kiritimatiellae bacterium]|nr:5-formyltetrahydrofolate cyclo-ligase [Kiritimatiellia bacterium]